jgi:hypothetical protein
MLLAILFWALMLGTLLFCGWNFRAQAREYKAWGPTLLIWLILVIIGWKVFGFIVQG